MERVMSVYQVEEYYVYLKFKVEPVDKLQQEIENYLSREYLDDFELTSEGLTVDSFDAESEAEEFEANFINHFTYLF